MLATMSIHLTLPEQSSRNFLVVRAFDFGKEVPSGV